MCHLVVPLALARATNDNGASASTATQQRRGVTSYPLTRGVWAFHWPTRAKAKPTKRDVRCDDARRALAGRRDNVSRTEFAGLARDVDAVPVYVTVTVARRGTACTGENPSDTVAVILHSSSLIPHP